MSQQFYVIRKQDDDLEHRAFKYIKKKKINGKWRYYYDREAAEKEMNAYKKAVSSEDERSEYVNLANTKDFSKKGSTKAGKKQEVKDADAKLDSYKKDLEALKRRLKDNKYNSKGFDQYGNSKVVDEKFVTLREQQIKDLTKAKKKYEESKTIKGKYKALKKTAKDYGKDKIAAGSAFADKKLKKKKGGA